MSAAPRPTLVDSRRQFWWGEHELIDHGIPAHIGTSAWTIYTCLLRHVNAQSITFPSVQLLMAESGLSNRVIAKSIATLKEVRLIEVDRTSHQWNEYRVLDALQAIRHNGWAPIKEARDEKSPAPESGKKHVTKGHVARDEKSPEQVTKSHTKKNQLKTTRKEGGEYNLEGDARATQAPAAPVVEPSPAPITTSFASLETAGGQTSPATGVAVLPPDGGAADAAVTDTDLEFLFGDQATEGQETGMITEVQEVPGGPAAPRGAQEGQEGLPGLADDPHDPEATRALLLPALGGQKKLNSLMEETPPGLRGKTRRGWITEITPERAAELITEARREAGADNPWTYIIRALDQELGAQLKKGQQAGAGIRGWNADVSGGANFPQTKPPVEPEPEQPTDTAGVGTRWEHKHTTDRTVTVTAVDGGYVELDGGERMLRFLLHKDFKRVN